MIHLLGRIVLTNCLVSMLLSGGTAGEGLLIRPENFTVPPSTGPVTHVLVRNPGPMQRTVTIRPRFGDAWRWTPAERTVTIGPGRAQRLPFAIEKALDTSANRYPVEIGLLEQGRSATRTCEVVCAAAPYLKPKIDGKFNDWADAIAVTFTTGPHKTVVATCWNKEYFCLYVQVAEEKLNGYKRGAGTIDAVQFALAPRNARTPSAPDAPAARYEFLIVNSAQLFAGDRCFMLISPGQEVSLGLQARPLDALRTEQVRLSVRRRGKVTHYECAVPFALMPLIKPEVGREFCFSLLVHDPDGTGLRDLGAALGLWPDQKNEYAWCKWQGADWPEEAPFDGKLEWGLCSSKH